jgi:prolipoprotein diacylglyceryltransferase
MIAPTTGLLDRLARPSIAVLGARWSSFKLLGFLGAALGIALAIWLASQRGLSVLTVAIVSAVALGLAVALYAFTWKLAGTQRLVFYRYQVVILLGVAAALWLLGRPVGAYLDLAILGLGAFLVAGRLGCFMVGCCHGIPHHHGVAYGDRHVQTGFPPHLEHVRLVPVQAIESLWVLAMAVAGAIAFARGSEPGWLLLSWLQLYGFARFHLELLRGDAARRHLAGFSEAQWTSLVLVALSVVAGIAGWLPLRTWHVALAVLIGLEMLATAARRALGTGAHLLSHPRHVDQLAQLVFELDRAPDMRDTLVGTTSLGISLSMARGDDPATRLFTLSRPGAELPGRDVSTLVRWLTHLGRFSGKPVLHVRDSGVVHVIFSQRPEAAVDAAGPPTA